MGDLGCGVPPRAVCAVEYVAAMRRIWRICAERRSERPPTVAVSLVGCEPSDVQELAAIGVDELVILDAPPAPSHEVDARVSGLAARWIG